jgi:hypothetical protein
MIDPRLRLAHAMNRTVDWLEAQYTPILDSKATLPETPEYARVRREYRLIVYEAVIGYLDSEASVARYKNLVRRAVADHFPQAFYAGYAESGAEETEAEDEQWLTGRIGEELEFVVSLFDSLKEKRGMEGLDPEVEADSRADGYAATLDGIHTEGVMRGMKNAPLEWRYGDTEHCDTCSKLHGQKHKAKWYLDRDYIPRKPGAAMDCGGYNCQCTLLDKDGKEITI